MGFNELVLLFEELFDADKLLSQREVFCLSVSVFLPADAYLLLKLKIVFLEFL